MEKWAYSVSTVRTGSTVEVRHLLGFVMAGNRAEALGLATLLGSKAYPSRDGWVSHHAMVLPVSRPAENPDLPPVLVAAP